MKPDVQTIGFYANNAQKYASDVEPQEMPPSLLKFAARLPEGGKVLDMGCGGGWAAKAFSGMGFSVLAIDPVQAFVDIAADLPGVDAKLGDFSTLDAQSEFDGIWCYFSLQHLPRKDVPPALAALAQAMKPGGWLMLGVHEGEEEHRDALDRHYTHFAKYKLSGMLERAGFQTEASEHFSGHGYDGRPIDMMRLEARRND